MSSRWDQLRGQDYVSCCWQVLPVQGRAAKKEGQRKGEKREREIDRERGRSIESERKERSEDRERAMEKRKARDPSNV